MNNLNRFLLILLASLSMAACNTMHGVGQDIEEAGDAVHDALDETQDEID